MDKLPFFYYDILSRITPGAATLATLFLVQGKMPPSWHYFFVDGQQGWKTVVVPLLLGGLTYAIGVFFEVIDSCPGWKAIVSKYDTHAFRKAWSLLGQGQEDLTKLSDEETGRRKYALWEALVFKAGMDPGFEKLFGHCHRFQAEYKMMLHLIYAVVLFGFFSIWANKGYPWIIASVAAAFFLFFAAHSRNTRRWLQAITFGRSLKIIDEGEK